MSRPLRVNFPGAYYHVMNRRLAYQGIFETNNRAVSDLPNSTNSVIAVRCRAIPECMLKECCTM